MVCDGMKSCRNRASREAGLEKGLWCFCCGCREWGLIREAEVLLTYMAQSSKFRPLNHQSYPVQTLTCQTQMVQSRCP